MSLLSRPFDAVTEADVHELVARQAREGPTLDFKQTLDLSESGRLDFLGDVTAMANSAGGTLVYGAVEGDGEDRGLIVGVRPLALTPDDVDLRVAHLLRDGVEERVPGVRHRAVPLAAGGYVYVVRVPASPLAPHMVTLPSKRPRFYRRGNVSNEPMNVQQIKDAAARGAAAEARAAALIAACADAVRAHEARRRTAVQTRERVAAERAAAGQAGAPGHDTGAPGGLALVHAVSLFPPRGGIDLADEAVYAPFVARPPNGSLRVVGYGSARERFGLDGLSREYGEVGSARGGFAYDARQYTRLLRAGGLECAERELFSDARYRGGARRAFRVWDAERLLLDTLDEARVLTEAGVLTLPLAVSLQVLDVEGAALVPEEGSGSSVGPDAPDAVVEPVVLASWGSEADAAARRLCDALWQGWGIRRSRHFLPDATLQPRAR